MLLVFSSDCDINFPGFHNIVLPRMSEYQRHTSLYQLFQRVSFDGCLNFKCATFKVVFVLESSLVSMK